MNANPSLLAARSTLVRQRDRLDRAITALDDVIADNVTEDPGTLRVQSERKQPRTRGVLAGGATGVGRVLRARPGVGFTASELADAMIANGWDAPEDPDAAARAARAAANRLRRSEPSRYVLTDGRFLYQSKLDEDSEKPGQKQAFNLLNGSAEGP